MRFSRPIFSALAIATVSAASAQYWNLGSNNIATAVSGNGVAAGFNTSQFFTWTAGGGLVGIGGQVPGNGNGGYPSISSDGSRVGGSANASSGLSEMAYYDRATATWTTCGNLGSSSGSSASAGFSMGASGQYFGGNAWVSAGTAHAVSYHNGVMTDLGSNVAGKSSRADGMSSDGSLAGGYQEAADGEWFGAVWLNGVETNLSNNGLALGQVHAVSSNGQWAAGGGNYNNFQQAYLWNRTTGQASFLDGSSTFASNYDTVEATAISADGSVVVGDARDTDPLDFGTADIAWIWTQATGVQTLDSYAAAHGINTGGQYFEDAYGLSPDGHMIVGRSTDAFGFANNGFAMSIATPEPASMAALAIGVLAILRRRKSK